MVHFLLLKKFKNSANVKAALRRVCSGECSSHDVELCNKAGDSQEVTFWQWVIGQIRALHPRHMAEATLWLSYLLRARGLTWNGMALLADNGICASRRQIERWELAQNNMIKKFTRWEYCFFEHTRSCMRKRFCHGCHELKNYPIISQIRFHSLIFRNVTS